MRLPGRNAHLELTICKHFLMKSKLYLRKSRPFELTLQRLVRIWLKFCDFPASYGGVDVFCVMVDGGGAVLGERNGNGLLKRLAFRRRLSSQFATGSRATGVLTLFRGIGAGLAGPRRRRGLRAQLSAGQARGAGTFASVSLLRVLLRPAGVRGVGRRDQLEAAWPRSAGGSPARRAGPRRNSRRAITCASRRAGSPDHGAATRRHASCDTSDRPWSPRRPAQSPCRCYQVTVSRARARHESSSRASSAPIPLSLPDRRPRGFPAPCSRRSQARRCGTRSRRSGATCRSRRARASPRASCGRST